MPPLADITRRMESGVPVSTVSGEIDLSNVDSVEIQLLRDVPAHGPFVLDMDGVTFLDSVGIAMLDRISRRVPGTRLVTTARGPVARLLDLVGLALPRHATVDEAVQDITGS